VKATADRPHPRRANRRQTWSISSRNPQTVQPACAADTSASLLFVNGVYTAEIVTLDLMCSFGPGVQIA
jgi:hypothetical protein